jgi:uncharacterized protein YegP (UPF0339 family)
LSLAGSANDNNSVTIMSWSNSRGGSGAIDAASSWTTAGIALFEGENVITIAAKDAAGNEGQDRLTVNYTVPIAPPPIGEGLLSGLKAAWLMEEGSGTTVQDASGNGYDGAFGHNGTSPNPDWILDPTYQEVVNITGADWLQNKGNYIDLGSLDLAGNAMTIGIRFKADNLVPWDGRLITKQTGRQEYEHYWMLSRYSDGKLRFRLKTNGKVTTLISSKSNLYKAGDWVFAVATYDGSTMRLYCNGAEVGSVAKTGAIDTDPNCNAYIGAAKDGGMLSATFDGKVDTAFAFERALSSTEIQQLHQEGTGLLAATHDTAPDTTAPSLSILEPIVASGGTFETNLSTITLSGTAHDDVGVVSVKWESSAGKSGIAQGSASWSIPTVDLVEGKNIITLSALDAAGNIGVATLGVTYTVPIAEPPISEGLLSGLKAAWLMEEGSGTTVHDASGNGYDGSFGRNGTSPNPDWILDPTHQEVVNITGADWLQNIGNYIDLGSLDLAGNAMTIGIRFKADNLVPWDGRLIAKQTGRQEYEHYWMLSRYSDGKLRFRLRTNGKVTTLISSKSNLYKAGDWVFAAATYDGSTMRLYCNGAEVGSVAKTGAIDTDPNCKAYIGAAKDGGMLSATFDGKVDTAFAFERALSASEIQQLHQGGFQIMVAPTN